MATDRSGSVDVAMTSDVATTLVTARSRFGLRMVLLFVLSLCRASASVDADVRGNIEMPARSHASVAARHETDFSRVF